jgi:predicted aspartyl protease
MGLTHVTVRVSNVLRQGEPYEAEFLADTGVVDSMVPGDRLLTAGIEPEGKDFYELANGESVEYETGFARLSFAGLQTVSPVVFGPTDCQPILGVVAMEGAGVLVDPVSRELRKVRAKPLK